MQKLKAFTSVTALSLLLAGCASSGRSYEPPVDPGVDYSRSYAADFSSVWDATVDWFALNNIPIKNIEKDSGIISSEYALGSDFTQVDCGTYDYPMTIVKPDFNANINILVRERGSSTIVNPNLFGSGVFEVYTVFDDYVRSEEAERCVSTGEIEESLHSYLESNL